MKSDFPKFGGATLILDIEVTRIALTSGFFCIEPIARRDGFRLLGAARVNAGLME